MRNAVTGRCWSDKIACIGGKRREDGWKAISDFMEKIVDPSMSVRIVVDSLQSILSKSLDELILKGFWVHLIMIFVLSEGVLSFWLFFSVELDFNN